jgi:hypothetical protein
VPEKLNDSVAAVALIVVPLSVTTVLAPTTAEVSVAPL